MLARSTGGSFLYASAYTLIEILVSLTIIGILFGFGYVGFRDFSRRQSIASAAKLIQGDLRLAQQQALSGKKPEAGCVNLDGVSFRVESADFGGSYAIEFACSGLAPATEIKSVTLPADISITSTQPTIQFNVLGNGTNISNGDATVTLVQKGTSYTTVVTVTSGGEIK